MKIAFINHPTSALSIPYEGSDSVGIVAYNLARQLAATEDVTICARRRGSEPAHAVTSDGVKVLRFRHAHKPAALAEAFAGALGLTYSLHKSSAFGLRFATRAAREIARGKPDIIHVMTHAHFVPTFRRWNPDAIITLHFHGDVSHRFESKRFVECVTAADHVFGCSEFLVRALRTHIGSDKVSLSVAHNGVDTEVFRPGIEHRSGWHGPEILYVGRLSPEKGVHVLLEALPRILRRIPDARLRIVGASTHIPPHARPPFLPPVTEQEVAPYYGRTFIDRAFRRTIGRRTPYFAGLIERWPAEIRERVILESNIPHSALPERYRRAAVVVLSSISGREAFGLPIIEAMACGVPVVATDGGGVGELVEDMSTGRLVPRNDPGAMADAICQLLESPDLGRRLAATALEGVVPRFTWPRVASDLLHQYQALAGRDR